MVYHFDELTQRRGTGSLKWDVKENELPMWVADMDFQTAPEIKDAVMSRAGLGIYGYGIVPEEWYEAYGNWWQSRHHFKMEHEWLIFCTGVVPAISSIVRKLTTVGENVLVQTPVYNIFFNSICNNGRNVLVNQLKYDGNEYSMDFEDLEKKLADQQTSMMLLCNPQNPGGRMWDRETLVRVGELCARYHVLVIADEIHCDLTEPGCEYIPFASVSEVCRENSITCIAPTKTFNLAGLQTAAVAVPNEYLRHKVERGLNTDEVAEPNFFAVTAAVAAYTRGGAWLDELRVYLAENRRLAVKILAERLPQIMPVNSQATYLLWLDCRKVTEDSGELCRFIRSDSGLFVTDGSVYGENGRGFIRMNIACPRERMEDGLERLIHSVTAYGDRT